MRAPARHGRLRVLGGGIAAAAFVFAMLALTASSASAQTPTFVPTVVMTVTETTLDFRSLRGLTPATVPDGKVSFQLRNKSHGWRTFSIQNTSTRRIAPGKSGTLTVDLPSASQYYYTVGAMNEDSSVEGVVRAVDFCTEPRKSTVVVKLHEGPLASSPEDVRCGTVTFVLKNTEKGDDSFTASLPGTTEPTANSPTREIGAGKTLRMTVQYRFKGIVSFGSAEPMRDTLYGEFGALAII